MIRNVVKGKSGELISFEVQTLSGVDSFYSEELSKGYRMWHWSEFSKSGGHFHIVSKMLFTTNAVAVVQEMSKSFPFYYN